MFSALKLYLAGGVLVIFLSLAGVVYLEVRHREHAAYTRGLLDQKVRDDHVVDSVKAAEFTALKATVQATSQGVNKTIEHWHTTVVDTSFARLPLQTQVDSLTTLGNAQVASCRLLITQASLLQTSCDTALAAKDRTIADLNRRVNLGNVSDGSGASRVGLGLGIGPGVQWQPKRRPTLGLNVSVEGQVHFGHVSGTPR